MEGPRQQLCVINKGKNHERSDLAKATYEANRLDNELTDSDEEWVDGWPAKRPTLIQVYVTERVKHLEKKASQQAQSDELVREHRAQLLEALGHLGHTTASQPKSRETISGR